MLGVKEKDRDTTMSEGKDSRKEEQKGGSNSESRRKREKSRGGGGGRKGDRRGETRH